MCLVVLVATICEKEILSGNKNKQFLQRKKSRHTCNFVFTCTLYDSTAMPFYHLRSKECKQWAFIYTVESYLVFVIHMLFMQVVWYSENAGYNNFMSKTRSKILEMTIEE